MLFVQHENHGWWTEHNPHPYLPAPLGGGKRAQKGGRGGKVFLRFISYYPALFFQAIKSINILKLSLFCPWEYLVSVVSLSLFRLMNHSSYLLSPVHPQKWVLSSFGGCLASSQGKPTAMCDILCSVRVHKTNQCTKTGNWIVQA